MFNNHPTTQTATNLVNEMKVLVVYYSLYGHTFQLAQAVKEGVASVKGTEVLFRRVEEYEIVIKKTEQDAYLSQVRDRQRTSPFARSMTCAKPTG